MPQGMLIKDASGNIILDIDTKISRILGTVEAIPPSNGSITPVGSDTGTLFALIMHPDGASYPSAYSYYPVITTTSTTISWSWSSFPSSSTKLRCTILYGVY